MPSPFPGMDPYLESHWGDVHTSIATYARNQLQPQLPAELTARVEEHVSVDEADLLRQVVPDVRVIERNRLRPSNGATATVEVATPVEVPLVAEPLTQRSVRVIDTASGRRVITAIEILSPGNKLGDREREKYRAKQRDLLRGGVNLVEIDLVRSGEYVLTAPYSNLPPGQRDLLRICVVRAGRLHTAQMYPMTIRERLPAIWIPLREADDDVVLDVQELVDRAYDDGDYGGDIDYTLEPTPRLSTEDAAWADELLREKKLR